MTSPLALALGAASLAAVALYAQRARAGNTGARGSSSGNTEPGADLWSFLNVDEGSSPFLPAPATPGPSYFDFLLDMTKPRGIRNNNPGNVKRSGSAWLGKVPHSQSTDATFEQFSAPVYGIRVIGYLLLKYQRDKGKKTVKALISDAGGWAPSNTDGNPAAYATAVAKAVGLRETDFVDLFAPTNALQGIVTAIIKFENGQQPYTADLIAEGVRQAREAVR